MGTLKIITDQDAQIIIDQEFMAEVKAGQLWKTELTEGVYILEVIATCMSQCYSYYSEDLRIDADHQSLKRINLERYWTDDEIEELEEKNRRISPKTIMVGSESKTGFVRKDGTVALPFIYDSATKFELVENLYLYNANDSETLYCSEATRFGYTQPIDSLGRIHFVTTDSYCRGQISTEFFDEIDWLGTFESHTCRVKRIFYFGGPEEERIVGKYEAPVYRKGKWTYMEKGNYGNPTEPGCWYESDGYDELVFPRKYGVAVFRESGVCHATTGVSVECDMLYPIVPNDNALVGIGFQGDLLGFVCQNGDEYRILDAGGHNVDDFVYSKVGNVFAELSIVEHGVCGPLFAYSHDERLFGIRSVINELTKPLYIGLKTQRHYLFCERENRECDAVNLFTQKLLLTERVLGNKWHVFKDEDGFVTYTGHLIKCDNLFPILSDCIAQEGQGIDRTGYLPGYVSLTGNEYRVLDIEGRFIDNERYVDIRNLDPRKNINEYGICERAFVFQRQGGLLGIRSYKTIHTEAIYSEIKQLRDYAVCRKTTGGFDVYDLYVRGLKTTLPYDEIWYMGNEQFDVEHGGWEEEHDTFIVESNAKQGLLSSRFTQLLPCEYQSIRHYLPGYYMLMNQGKVGLIDDMGWGLFPCQYDMIEAIPSEDGIPFWFKATAGSNKFLLIGGMGQSIPYDECYSDGVYIIYQNQTLYKIAEGLSQSKLESQSFVSLELAQRYISNQIGHDIVMKLID